MREFSGKIALVTGASRGIGKSVALELGCRGAAVAVHYRRGQAEAEEVAERIRSMGVPCMTVQGDLGDKEEARRVVARVLEEWQHLHILVNNAGITRDSSMRRMADDAWADVINVNLNGTYYCTRAALPAMIEQKFGRIINISSYVGQTGHFGQANYAASKGAVIAFTKTVALEMARFNITANTVAPGFTLTDMLSEVPRNLQEQIIAKIPLGRFGKPEEVARAVIFLAADGDYITGQQINVNGGMYM